MLSPTTLDEICSIARVAERLLPVGSRSKSALCTAAAGNVTYVDMRRYSGVVSYDPGEFLVSVRAGTTIKELSLVLLAHGQYLPFDPVFLDRQATVGGSVASGLSGPGRLLYGGLRDFLLEVAMVDSAGREIRGGGKVVKNAAGFDLPKLVAGSYGRLGILTEVTLKVFPMPPAWHTLRISLTTFSSAVATMQKLLSEPLPIAAMEIDRGHDLDVRLAGPAESLSGMAARVKAALPREAKVEEMPTGQAESQLWRDRAEFDWAAGHPILVRVATTSHQCIRLHELLRPLADATQHVASCGGSVMWIAVQDSSTLEAVDTLLTAQNLQGIVICGATNDLHPLGNRAWTNLSERVRLALDEGNKFPSYLPVQPTPGSGSI